MLRLTLVRHATTPWNEAKRYQGWADPPLSPTGRDEAARLATRFAAERWDMAFSSDLARARETAGIALPEFWAEPDPRLREMGWGDWEGLTYDECMQQDPERLRAWTADPTSTTPPAGEPLGDFAARIADAISALPPEGDVLWITHAGVIRAVLATLLGVELTAILGIRISPTGITQAEIFSGGGAIVGCVNATGHLGRGMIPLTGSNHR